MSKGQISLLSLERVPSTMKTAPSTLTPMLAFTTAPCPVQPSVLQTLAFRYSKSDAKAIQCMGSTYHSYFRRHCKPLSTISVFYLLHIAREVQGYLHLKTWNSFIYHHFPGAGEEICLVMPKPPINQTLQGPDKRHEAREGNNQMCSVADSEDQYKLKRIVETLQRTQIHGQ